MCYFSSICVIKDSPLKWAAFFTLEKLKNDAIKGL